MVKHKMKVNMMSICLINYHSMKVYGEVKVYLHSYFNHAIEVGGHLHVLAASPPGKAPSIPIGHEAE
jgi:hypothetical protein